MFSFTFDISYVDALVHICWPYISVSTRFFLYQLSWCMHVNLLALYQIQLGFFFFFWEGVELYYQILRLISLMHFCKLVGFIFVFIRFFNQNITELISGCTTVSFTCAKKMDFLLDSFSLNCAEPKWEIFEWFYFTVPNS